MRVSFLTLSVVLAQSALANVLKPRQASCRADNCARQVTGTKATKPLATRQADCNSFLKTTTYVVQTVAVDSRPTSVPTSPPSQFTPTAVPTYINNCGTSSTAQSRYSSACACLTGVTKQVLHSTTTSTVYAQSPSNTACATATGTRPAIFGPTPVTYTYVRQLVDSGYITDPDTYSGGDPSVDTPVETKTYPATYTDCEAIDACAQDVALGPPGRPSGSYTTFDLHYLSSDTDPKWECFIYPQGFVAADFKVYNADAVTVYGYTQQN